MITSTNVHYVKSADISFEHSGTTGWLKLMIRTGEDSDHSQMEITIFRRRDVSLGDIAENLRAQCEDIVDELNSAAQKAAAGGCR